MYPMLSLSNPMIISDFTPLSCLYENEIEPMIVEPMRPFIDKEAIIIGEVLLLIGAEHDPKRPTLRLALQELVTPEARDKVLTKFWNLAYRILETINLYDQFEYEIQPIGGYCLAIKRK